MRQILGGCRDDGAAGDRAANRADPGAGDGAGKGKIGRKLSFFAQLAANSRTFAPVGNRAENARGCGGFDELWAENTRFCTFVRWCGMRWARVGGM